MDNVRLYARSVSRFLVPLVGAIALVIVMLMALSPALPGRSEANEISIGLVPDINGIDDHSINQAAYDGLLRAESTLNVIASVYTPADDTDYENQLQNCVDNGNDLCIGVGFLLSEPVSNTAAANPQTNFAVVDFTFENPPANLRGLDFAEDQAGYLAGTLAGMMTESDVVGAVGGIPVPAVVEFLEGYRWGAYCSNPQVTTVLSYTDSFVDPDLGAQVAQDQIAMGADVIFAAAGETGHGAILTSTQSSVWSIGVDVDQYYQVFGGGSIDGSDFLLSSAMKKFDNAVYDTIYDQINSAFTPGNLLYDLAVDSVGLAPFHETDPFVSQAVRDRLEWVKNGLINGSIDPLSDCYSYIFLPALVR